ncbi:MAG: hypothetical protein ABEH40_01110 [Haloferacaceae archaeon]
MTDIRHTLGVGYLVGSGTTLAAVLVAAGVAPGGGIGPLLGALPALGLAAAPVWLPRVRIDAAAVWRTAVWAALGVGAFALLDVGLLLGGRPRPGAPPPGPGVVAYGVGFGGVCGALIGCLLELNRRSRTLTEQNAVMRRVLRHDLRTEANLVLGHARAAASEADEGTRPHLDEIAASIRRLLDRGRRVRRLQRGAAARPTDDRSAVAVVEDALDAAREEYPGARPDLVAAGDPRVRANDLVVRAVAEVVGTAAAHVPDGALVVTVADAAPGGGTVGVRIRTRDGGGVLPDADLHAMDGGGETPLRHGRHTGLWAAKWCLERHGGRFAVAGPDAVVLGLRRARGRLPRRVVARVRAAVPRALR